MLGIMLFASGEVSTTPMTSPWSARLTALLTLVFATGIFARDDTIGNPDQECAGCCGGGDSGPAFADPVYFFNGEFHLEASDLHIPGRGFDFELSRKYRSKTGRRTILGYNWDLSYNIYLEKSGSHGENLMLFDGTGRHDLFVPDGNGHWVRREYFAEIVIASAFYELHFADGKIWRFVSFDGSPSAGKIHAIADRNGNTMSFVYDSQGRLSTVTDTLGRTVTFSFGNDDLLDSVTDWVGRTVTYEYDDHEDLVSVTTPAVLATEDFPIPPGHEFSNGSTTTFSYSSGLSPESRNHNLLTIMDAFGQIILCNCYSDAQDEHDFQFDRIITQVYGDEAGCDPGGCSYSDGEHAGFRFDFTYVDKGGELLVIVNNRAGFVKELSYDSLNRLIDRRDYTGTAPNIAAPTTEQDNRPVNKLRVSDPAYFETLYEYNNDSRRTRIIHPNGNEETFTYDESNLEPRRRGNLLQHTWLPGPLGGDQTTICESFEYNSDFGGCCGFNFPTRHIDANEQDENCNRTGQGTLYEYDDHGNLTRTVHRLPGITEEYEYNAFGQMTAHVLPDNGNGYRRRDAYTYYDSGDQNGYLKETIVDADGLALTTHFEYDKVGNLTKRFDAKNHDTQYVYNQLNQVVLERSREVVDGGPRYERETFYDANNNVVRIEVQNVDADGNVPPNASFTTDYSYDELNYKTGMTQEVADGKTVRTSYGYDANKNLANVYFGEYENGHDRRNTVLTTYDERDLPFVVSRAPGLTRNGNRPKRPQSSTQYDYDLNGNVSFVREGTENDPRVHEYRHDGYNRVWAPDGRADIDPMGNTTAFTYDANGNLLARILFGELKDGPGDSGNVKLAQARFEYDLMDRRIAATNLHFDPNKHGHAIGDGESRTDIFYSDASQVIMTVDDNGHEVFTEYDTANRAVTITDAKGNQRAYTYDANSNVISVLESEHSDVDQRVEQFTTAFAYDNLDRLTKTTDNVGNAIQYAYDSRGNRVRTTDALGNVVHYEFDGLNRLVATTRDMTDTGRGGGKVVGTIVTRQEWDDDSRLIAQIDDNGNATRYAYDPLNRLIVTQMADGTITQVGHGATWPLGQRDPNLSGFKSGYDVHDNAFQTLDANGTLVTNSYDLLNRITRRDVTTFGEGVSHDTTYESYKYDGLSRLVFAEDDDSRVVRKFDSMSNLTEETQYAGPPFENGRTVANEYDGVGNLLKCTYPGSSGNGSDGRVVKRKFDELNRPMKISDQDGMIATYKFVGPGRVDRREYGNGARSDYTYDGVTGVPNPENDFGVKHIIATTHTRINDGLVLDDRTYTWDPMGNKTQRKDVREDGPKLTRDYSYDSIYRLIRSVKSDPNGGSETIDYHLDGVGNRISLEKNGGADKKDPNAPPIPLPEPPPGEGGEGGPGRYTMNSRLPEPADKQVNQYSTTPFDSRKYDKNGNLVLIDEGKPTQRKLTYDFRNRTVEFLDAGSMPPNQRHVYRYDCLGRRVAKIVDADGVGDGPIETRFFYGGQADWQILEEQGRMGATLADYVYGIYIDSLLTMRRDTDSNYQLENYYAHTDDSYCLILMCNDDGIVVSRYEYGDFGFPVFLDPNGNSIPLDPKQQPFLFTGRQWDAERNSYYYRYRTLEPSAGVFSERDQPKEWVPDEQVASVFYQGEAGEYAEALGYLMSSKTSARLTPSLLSGIWSDSGNLGNGYAYAHINPWSLVDPMGRQCELEKNEFIGWKQCHVMPRGGFGPWQVVHITHVTVYVDDSHTETDEADVSIETDLPIPGVGLKTGTSMKHKSEDSTKSGVEHIEKYKLVTSAHSRLVGWTCTPVYMHKCLQPCSIIAHPCQGYYEIQDCWVDEYTVDGPRQRYGKGWLWTETKREKIWE